MSQKLSVESAELINGVFICECFLGDDYFGKRWVAFHQLVKFMGGEYGMVPVNDSDRESNEYQMPLTIWIENNDHFELCWELSRCINQMEGRTEFEPSRIVDNHPFLPLTSLIRIVNDHAA